MGYLGPGNGIEFYTSSVSCPAAPNPTRWRGFILRGRWGWQVEKGAAPYPSGKGEVCKTFMRRFESARRLTEDPLNCVAIRTPLFGVSRWWLGLVSPGWRNW